MHLRSVPPEKCFAVRQLSERAFPVIAAPQMKTVLIVEDDAVNARVFSKILTKRGGFEAKHTENVE